MAEASSFPPALQIHFNLLKKWSKVMDLVGPGPLEEHFEDSFAALRALEKTEKKGISIQGNWADLGSGAGFPGVPLAVMFPATQVSLIERREKRALFLEQVVAEARSSAGLTNAVVAREDAERLPPGSLAGVTGRAFLPSAEFLPLAHALLQPGGLFLLLLAREDAPAFPGLSPFHVEPYKLRGRPRKAVVLRKDPAPSV